MQKEELNGKEEMPKDGFVFVLSDGIINSSKTTTTPTRTTKTDNCIATTTVTTNEIITSTVHTPTYIVNNIQQTVKETKTIIAYTSILDVSTITKTVDDVILSTHTVTSVETESIMITQTIPLIHTVDVTETVKIY